MTKPATQRQQRRRAAEECGLTHMHVWATKDNMAAVKDAQEHGEEIIAAKLKEKGQ